jgi:hypothetical protein
MRPVPAWLREATAHCVLWALRQLTESLPYPDRLDFPSIMGVTASCMPTASGCRSPFHARCAATHASIPLTCAIASAKGVRLRERPGTEFRFLVLSWIGRLCSIRAVNPLMGSAMSVIRGAGSLAATLTPGRGPCLTRPLADIGTEQRRRVTASFTRSGSYR